MSVVAVGIDKGKNGPTVVVEVTARTEPVLVRIFTGIVTPAGVKDAPEEIYLDPDTGIISGPKLADAKDRLEFHKKVAGERVTIRGVKDKRLKWAGIFSCREKNDFQLHIEGLQQIA